MQPDHDDARGDHGRPADGVVDDTGRGADDAGSGLLERVEKLCRFAAVHRDHALVVAQLADRLAGRGLDVDVGVTPRPPEPFGEPLPDRRLARAHQSGDDDMADGRGRSAMSPGRWHGRDSIGPSRPVHSACVDAPTAIAPPAVIGILGGGQLGRMLGSAARAMGYRIAVLDPDPDCPAAAVADRLVIGSYDDVGAALRLADLSDVVTYELEHVAADVVEAIEVRVPVRPGRGPLVVTQDRLAERRFVEGAGVAVAPWREVRSVADARAAAERARSATPSQAADRWL